MRRWEGKQNAHSAFDLEHDWEILSKSPMGAFRGKLNCYMCRRTCAHICVYAHLCACLYAYLSIYLCMHLCMCTSAHVYVLWSQTAQFRCPLMGILVVSITSDVHMCEIEDTCAAILPTKLPIWHLIWFITAIYGYCSSLLV